MRSSSYFKLRTKIFPDQFISNCDISHKPLISFTVKGKKCILSFGFIIRKLWVNFKTSIINVFKERLNESNSKSYYGKEFQ